MTLVTDNGSVGGSDGADSDYDEGEAEDMDGGGEEQYTSIQHSNFRQLNIG